MRPGLRMGATVDGGGEEKGLEEEGELIAFPDTLLGSLGARVGGGARRAGIAAGA